MRPIPEKPCMGMIRAFEGKNGTFEATATQDPGGLWEIGWSHRIPGPTDEVWTEAQADQQALLDLETAAQGVCAGITEIIADGLTEGQYAALIDFTYNEGVGKFQSSTLCRLVREGNMKLAYSEFPKWVYGHDENGNLIELDGLKRRRQAEQAAWLATS